jgi:tetratricopeptide (TPR) repeat protein
MDDRFLSRFTPSLMSPDALEGIFVQREKLLQDILERLRKGALGGEIRNTLLVGPRGIGKTHLISLAYHRLRSMKEVEDRILIAWMREEEWGIAHSRDLLLRILRALEPEEEAQLAPIYALPPEQAENAAIKRIGKLVADKTLIILVENLDDLVRKLGGQGEMKFYNFLKQTRCSVVATSPGPAARVFPPGSPFRRNFFEIHSLKGLDFETAIQLLSKIAEYQGNAELISLINSPHGRARVRALRYLAGGNHRAYVIFAPLIARESIGQLIRPLMQTIDDLTPYYNSRIAALPWEQRQILEYVCEAHHPVRTGDVARVCFLPRAAAASQLESLCALGYLQNLRVGNDSYYELHEPLLRSSFEVKKHRGKPIGLLLDFLRLWYSPAELKQKLSSLPATSMPEQLYIPDLTALEQRWDDPRIAECCREYGEAVQHKDYERALKSAEDLIALRGLKEDWMAKASCFIGLNQLESAMRVYDKVIDQYGEDASVWRLCASVLSAMGRHEDALLCLRKSRDLDETCSDTWNREATLLLTLGRPEEALYACEAALKLKENDPFAWTILGTALVDLELYDESCRAFSKSVELEPQNTKARIHLSAALIEQRHWDEALQQAQSAVKISPVEPASWVLQGSALAGMGKREEALAAFDKAISLGESSAYVQFKVVELFLSLNRWRQAAARLDQALQQSVGLEDSVDAKTLIRCLLPSLSEPRVLRLLIKLLLLIHRKHRMLGILAHGLIVCIPDVIASDKFTRTDASMWKDCWEATASNLPEFRLPLRLLNSAAGYRTTGGLEVLMNLPQEERTLLEALLGIHLEAIA